MLNLNLNKNKKINNKAILRKANKLHGDYFVLEINGQITARMKRVELSDDLSFNEVKVKTLGKDDGSISDFKTRDPE